MAKKLVVVGIVLLLVGVFLFMRMRMSHMMAGQGSPSDLVAVSADGARLSSPVTGQDFLLDMHPKHLLQLHRICTQSHPKKRGFRSSPNAFEVLAC